MKQKQSSAAAEPRFAAFVAIDWADEKHVWCSEAADSRTRERGEVDHSPEAIESWVGMLSARFGSQPIAVAVEQSRGALVFMLSKYAQLYLYPIHPRAAAQFRAALFPSGVKDDPLDADLLLDLLVQHRRHLRRLDPDTEETRLVQNLVEARRKLVNEKTRQTNRLTEKLKLYFPQVLNWFQRIDSRLVGDLLERWPTLEKLQGARPATLRSFFVQHNCRHQEEIERRLEEVRKAIPAIRDPAVIRAGVVTVKVLVQLIATLREAIHELDREIEQTAAAHADFAIFNSFPGAGPVLAPRLLAAFGSHRDRYSSVEELQAFSGIAPVTQRSGKSQWVHFRWACPKFLRQTFHEWAAHSIPYSVWARAYYQQQIAKGNDHHAAVRSLAFKWIRVAFRCWKDHVPYNESIYLAALRRRGSALAAAVANPVNR
jgi:transposase